MARRVIVILLVSIATIVAATWIAFACSPRKYVKWDNDRDFLEPGHRSVYISRHGIWVDWTSEVRADSRLGIDRYLFGLYLRVSVLSAYSRPLANGRSLAPMTVAFAVPYWILLTLLLPYPASLVARRAFRRRRARRGLCPQCGYDLTNNTSGTCSECGQPVSAVSRRPKA